MVVTPQQFGVPESLLAAIESFTQRELSLQALSDVLSDVIHADPGHADAIHALLDDELENHRLTISDYGELVIGLGKILSEDIPTDCSELKPDTSGVYRIVDSDTMIFEETDIHELEALQSRSSKPEQSVPQQDDTDGYTEDVQSEPDAGLDPALATESEPEPEPEPEPQPEAISTIEAVLDVGMVLRERFRLDEKLGSGSMGVVFRATDLLQLESNVAEPWVAVKVINPRLADNPAALKALQNEIVSSQRLSHPNIIHLYDFDKDRQYSYVTMEWLKGQSLATFLDDSDEQPLNDEQAFSIVQQLGAALVYAHEHGVVHADIKPGNIFLCDSDEVKLLDFGLARITSALAVAIADDDALQRVMTPAYASCQRLEKQPACIEDDVFSFACLTYRLFAGRRPFGALTALDAEDRAMELLPIEGMPKSRWEALAAAMAYRKSQRTASVRDFLNAFLAEPAGTESVAVSPEAPEPESEPVADPPVLTAVAAVEPVVIGQSSRASEADVTKDTSVPDSKSTAAATQSSIFETATQAAAIAHAVRGRLAARASRIRLAIGIGAVGLVAILITTWVTNEQPDNVVVLNDSDALETNLQTDVRARSFAGSQPEPTTYSMLVVPTTESILVLDQPVAKKKVTASRRSAPPVEIARTPEPEPEPQEPFVTRVRTSAFPSDADQAFVTRVQTGAVSVDSELSVVTEVATGDSQSAALQSVVKEVETGTGDASLGGVVTTVAMQSPDPAAAPQFVPNEPVEQSDPADGVLPLSALKFSRYVEPDFSSRLDFGSPSGWIEVSFSVDVKGRTTDVIVADSSLPRRFHMPAISAVRKWRFEPYQRNGEAVGVASAVRLRVEE